MKEWYEKELAEVKDRNSGRYVVMKILSSFNIQKEAMKKKGVFTLGIPTSTGI